MWRCSLGKVIARPPLDLGGFLARELVRLGGIAIVNETNFIRRKRNHRPRALDIPTNTFDALDDQIELAEAVALPGP